MVRIKVKLFAGARQRAGCDEVSLELPEPATIGAVREALRLRWPELKPLVDRAFFAVNFQYSADATQLTDGQEVAWIPPVSGG